MDICNSLFKIHYFLKNGNNKYVYIPLMYGYINITIFRYVFGYIQIDMKIDILMVILE